MSTFVILVPLNPFNGGKAFNSIPTMAAGVQSIMILQETHTHTVANGGRRCRVEEGKMIEWTQTIL
jgi:hypothetical protein